MTQNPEVGTKYYTIGYFKVIDCVTWRDDIVDHYLWKQGKVFLTEEAARQAARQAE